MKSTALSLPKGALRRAAQGALSLPKGAAVAFVLLSAVASATPAQALPAASQAPATQVPPGSTNQGMPPTTPQGAPPSQPPTPVAPPAPEAAAAPPPTMSRTFTAPTGLLFNTVRPERVKDFETFLWYLENALQKSTDPGVQAQAKGWRTFKATEAGPNNTVMYVFVLDPAVKDADYSLGRILADAYPDTPQLTDIWKLYTSSVVGGGSLLNLTPVVPVAPTDPAAVAPPSLPGPIPPTQLPAPPAQLPTPESPTPR